MILDALPADKYSTIKTQAVRNPDLSLEDITIMIKTIFVNHSERSPVPKKGQESCRKDRDSGSTDGRESAMSAAITCHNGKKPVHEKNLHFQLDKRPDKFDHLRKSKKKWCTYHCSNGHSNENCYQQQSQSK